LGCSSELSTQREIESYVKKTYGKNFIITLIDSDDVGVTDSSRAGTSKTWRIDLKERDLDITFELENYLSRSIKFLDGASFGPVKSYYVSTYAQEKAKILHKEVLKIVDKYPDVEYVEDESSPSDRFMVYNSNHNEFIKCIKEIDKLYNFPRDTNIRFLATVMDENNNIVDTWLYSYSSGKKKLDTSLLKPR